MSSAESKLAMAKTVISTLGSMAATAMVVRTIVHDYLPPEFQDYLSLGLRNFFSLFSNQLTMVIDEFDGLVANEIYEAAEAYLGPKTSPKTRRLKVTKPEKERSISVAVERNQEFTDEFGGATFKWVLICRRIESKNFYNPRDIKSSLCAEVRSFELTLHKKHREMVIGSYLPHVVEQAKLNRQSTKTIKIFTADYENMYGNMADMWRSVSLDHPATIGTLAMDPEVKNAVIMDLDRFVKRREYYRKVGKAWKRGYLLYGPPGTGKSSLIAAMANYLNFDIYDLELTEVRHNSDLRRLLVATANRSILVVEDIDCTIDLQDRSAATSEWHPRALRRMGMQSEENKVTLSGFLNFIDGLWSSCGDERIIIFTTNHKDKLDPALLRPGRMDVHIHMSYCTPSGFKLLASNYLGIEDHLLFGEIEELVRMTNVTPAEVAEQLMKNDDIEVALGSLIDFLHGKKKRENEEKDEKLEVEFMGKREESEEITEQVDKNIAQRS